MNNIKIKIRLSLAASLVCLTSKISGLVMVTSAVGPNQVRTIGWYLRICSWDTLATSVDRYKSWWIYQKFVIFCGWFSLPCRYDVLCYGCNIVLVEGCFVAPSQSRAFKCWSMLRHTTVAADTSHCS